MLLTATLLISITTWAMPLVAIPINPDQNKTPGEFCDTDDKDFAEFRYAEKMPYCKRNVSKSIKTKVYALYKIPTECKQRYTVDHYVPLALGGNNSPDNLWPEHVLVKATRQKLEQELYLKVSRDEMSSEEAVYILTTEKMKLHLDLSDLKGCG